ncbi:alpha/beta hydrolase [Raineyella sp. W15-4]|uniref:alpha/beta hydrolase n=1 Tax=Raineyella sp. W15-4 TaxID=3081651 RepID=UPI002955197A|nr:alpha/beta hydrolase [Raineyella sp. W15-4]WOQ16723.1 alpha/beta hydrolase [Raineyella sp. W15-4]
MDILRRTLGGLALVAAPAAGLVLWDRLSPAPGAWLINRTFRRGDAAARATMEAYVPDGITGRTDVAYGTHPDERLDVWHPDDAHRNDAGADDTRRDDITAPRPAVVWVHGGGWVGGSKASVAPYLQILAGEGYTTIGLDYSLAPGARYPVPVRQVNTALAWIVEHAAELQVDPRRIVLAGDSAGAQIAGQVAVLSTDPSYATLLGLTPAVRADDLVGVLLHCGPYSPERHDVPDGLLGWFTRTMAWAYTGTQDLEAPVLREMSVVAHATAQFPPTLLSGGNADTLTSHGEALRDRLTALGVELAPFFWPADHQPALPHEFQFDLGLAEAREVLDASRTFLTRVTAG